MMRRDLLRQLGAFHAVGADGTITAAAQRLGKSPPAVHHDISRLEQRLGQKLFRKNGRRLQLTLESRQLHVEVGRLLSSLERELDRFSRAALAGLTLRVGVVTGFGRYRLAPLLFKHAGDQQIELTTGSHDEIVSLLLGGNLDVGVTYKPVVATPVECEPIANEQIVLVAPADSQPVEFGLATVERMSFVTYDEFEYVFGAWFSAALGGQPRRVRRSDHTTELEEALECVANGRGVTIIPADAWLNGPWRSRCRSMFASAPEVWNELFMLSIPGEEPAATSFIRGLFVEPLA